MAASLSPRKDPVRPISGSFRFSHTQCQAALFALATAIRESPLSSAKRITFRGCGIRGDVTDFITLGQLTPG